MDETTFHGCNESRYRSSIPSDAEVRFVPVCRGHAVVHHQSVWHGSGPNLSQRNDRRALVGHYLRGDVKFKDEGGGECVKSSFLLFLSGSFLFMNPLVAHFFCTDSCTLGVNILHLRQIQALQLSRGGRKLLSGNLCYRK